MRKKVFTDYASVEFEITSEARDVMVSIKELLDENAYSKMVDSLRGFHDDLQLMMAVNIRDSVCYGWERYTFLNHVDEILKSFYLEIDKYLNRI